MEPLMDLDTKYKNLIESIEYISPVQLTVAVPSMSYHDPIAVPTGLS